MRRAVLSQQCMCYNLDVHGYVLHEHACGAQSRTQSKDAGAETVYRQALLVDDRDGLHEHAHRMHCADAVVHCSSTCAVGHGPAPELAGHTMAVAESFWGG